MLHCFLFDCQTAFCLISFNFKTTWRNFQLLKLDQLDNVYMFTVTVLRVEPSKKTLMWGAG